MSDFKPFLISWNLTKCCNLRCDHCYLDASELEDATSDLSTMEAHGVVDQISSLCPGAMLILTGGEPLTRPDFFEIAGYASNKGLSVVVGTNGTLIDDHNVLLLKEAGVQGVGISLDSSDPSSHDTFRGMAGAWEKTMSAVDSLKSHGMDFQLQFTVTKNNYDEIPQLIELAYKKGAKAANVFFLVCTGRGQEMTDITPEQYEKMLAYLAKAETEYAGRMMVRARCAPHFLRLVQQKYPDSSVMKGATSGCIAGTGYFRITPDGDVTSCPYMPTSAGNIKDTPLATIWAGAKVFQDLRTPHYNGKCGDCSYNDVCGGCRARALANSGDLMGEDPWCEYKPESEESGLGNGLPDEMIWEPEAVQRLDKVPVFLKDMVKKGVERYARTKGLQSITPEIMADVRSKVGDGRS